MIIARYEFTIEAGNTIVFTYNNAVRIGVVDKVGVGPKGAYVTISTGEGFKSFTVDKMVNVTVHK